MLRELNQVIDYIELHLAEDLSLTAIADYAGVSDYHFRKVFYYISGMSLSEYIKNRRLSEAGQELLQGARVTDLAYKYGYESLDGFSRAFKNWSGMLPSEAGKSGSSRYLPKFNFVITVQGGIPMQYRIETKPAFNFAGVSKRVPMQFEGVNQEIVKLAQSITEEQRQQMRALRNLEPKEIVNVSYDADADFQREEGDLTHLIGVLTTENQISDLLDKIAVPACSWAVFPNEGPFPATLQQTMARAYSEWLPASAYELLRQPTFSFTKMSQEKPDHAYSEVWLPVRERK